MTLMAPTSSRPGPRVSVDAGTDTRLVGLVCTSPARLGAGLVYLVGLCDVPFTRRGICTDSMLLLAERVFSRWESPAVGFEAVAFNYEQFSLSQKGYFRQEARIQEHGPRDGRHWELIVGSVTYEGLRAIMAIRERRRVPVVRTGVLV